MTNATFTISLDCELYWGVRDRRDLNSYRENLLGDRQVTDYLLNLFSTYQIHATWAFVGFLFFCDKKELMAYLPEVLPSYNDTRLNPYSAIADIGDNEAEDPFHYGQSLIEKVMRYPHQEIGSHTFSHYYCLEHGQTKAQFTADLLAAKRAAERLNIHLRSLVFPRNQLNAEYLTVCQELGFLAFRGNEKSWFYDPSSLKEQSLLRRGGRLCDTYLNISGHHCHNLFSPKAELVDVPSSRFLRPYSKKLKNLEPLRLGRIKNSMTFAAQHRLNYHLWWHPHNFGVNMQENLAFLTAILDHYTFLNRQYNMQSTTMLEAANLNRVA
ncbi:MAG TPA: polysaccharide deacetylase family protein [Gammaproteobacteria bacterium]|nr:polysaccharide deacetylase family protein [Gammaproteobacteria bacterium]